MSWQQKSFKTTFTLLFNYFVYLLNKNNKMIFEIIKKRTEKVDSFSKLLQKAELEYENYLNKKHLNGLNH